MQRRVNASPTIRVCAGFSGRRPCRNVLRSPRAISWVVTVAVLTVRSAASVPASTVSVVMALLIGRPGWYISTPSGRFTRRRGEHHDRAAGSGCPSGGELPGLPQGVRARDRGGAALGRHGGTDRG